VFALSRLRIRQRMRKGDPRAKALYGYLQNSERFLWTILVGNTVSNLILVSLGVFTLYVWLVPHPLLLVAAFLLGAVLFYAFCELLPKMLFRLYPNRLCLMLATPFRTVHLLLNPVVSFMALISRWLGGGRFTGRLFGNRDELRIILQESGQSLTTEERTMINRVMDLQNLKLHDVAIPLEKAVTISSDTSIQEVLELCRSKGFSRFPVWQEQLGQPRIAGLLSIKSFLYKDEINPRQKAGDFLKPARFLQGDMPLEEALRAMQSHGQRMAIVLGPDLKETGIVSLQDILRAIFGEVSL